MDPQTLFAVAFPLAVPFWALMVLAPGFSVTRRVISSPLIAVPVLLVYVLALLPQLTPYWAAMTARRCRCSPGCWAPRWAPPRSGPT